MKKSAGILLYRIVNVTMEVFLVHPGGPFWIKKDQNSWSVPKGEFTDEDPLTAAIREFEEETGTTLVGDFIELVPVIQKSGKKVYCFSKEQDLDPGKLKSNTFQIEWPPKSGKMQEFPEIDRGEWFDLPTARKKIIESQIPFIDQVENLKS